MRSLIVCEAFILFVAVNVCAQVSGFTDGVHQRIASHSFQSDTGSLRYVFWISDGTTVTRPLLTLGVSSGVASTYEMDIDTGNAITKIILFTEASVYYYRLTTASGQTLDSGSIEILFDSVQSDSVKANAGKDPAQNTYVDYYTDPSSTMYYLYSKVEFTESEDTSYPPASVAVRFEMKNHPAGIPLNIWITNNAKPIATNGLIVDVMRKSGRREQLIETIHQAVDPDALAVNCRYIFQNKGNYVVNVYSAIETWISTGKVTIR